MKPNHASQTHGSRNLPLEVYLDSQDFSRFSVTSSEYTALLPVRQHLLKLRDEGLVRFPFSDIHIAECLPTDPRNAQGGQQRIETIAEFSQGHHFPNSILLMEYEVRLLLALRRRTKLPKFPSEWFCDFVFPKDALERAQKSVKADLRQIPGLNRRHRQLLFKRISRDKEAMGDEEFAAVGLNDLMAKYPFRTCDRQRLLRALRSPSSHVEVASALRDGLRDIANFAKWVITHWQEGKQFVEGLRSHAMTVEKLFTAFFKEMRSLQASNLDKDAKERLKVEQRRLLEELASQWNERFPEELLEHLLEKEWPLNGFGIRLEPGVTPSLFAVLQFFTFLIAEAARVEKPRNPHGAAANDYADGMHILFFPRVDVFRADRFASSLLKRSVHFTGTSVAPSLKQLPILLEKLAAERTQNQQQK